MEKKVWLSILIEGAMIESLKIKIGSSTMNEKLWKMLEYTVKNTESLTELNIGPYY